MNPPTQFSPWALDTNLTNGDLTVETEHQGISVARVSHQDPQNDGGRSFDLEREIGRLITAAPELLAALIETRKALRDAMDRLESARMQAHALQYAPALEAARTAIIKARGTL